jgi:carbon starvation protein CstA
MRRDGKSLGQMAVFAIMVILLAVLALVAVNALADSLWAPSRWP